MFLGISVDISRDWIFNRVQVYQNNQLMPYFIIFLTVFYEQNTLRKIYVKVPPIRVK